MGGDLSTHSLEDTHDSGDDRYIELQKSLVRDRKNSLDFNAFCRLISSRYERMPQILCECLYLAYAPSIHSKIYVNDFLNITKAFINGNRPKMVRFLFRVYDIKSARIIDRDSVEGVLKTVYGSRRGDDNQLINGVSVEDEQEAISLLDALFPQDESELYTGNMQQKRGISLLEFDQFAGRLDIMSTWISTVLRSILDVPLPHILQLERKYSSTLEPEEVMSRFNLSKAKCDKLRVLFYSHCGAQKHELGVARWMLLCGTYLSPNLASALFRAKARGFKNIWRFTDFAEFCLIHGAGSIEDQALSLCKTFYLGHKARASYKSNSNKASKEDDNCDLNAFLREMRMMVLLLAQINDERSTKATQFSANLANTVRKASSKNTEEELNPETETAEVEPITLEVLAESTYLSNEMKDALVLIEESARDDGAHPSVIVQYYVDLLIKHHNNLPGVRELSITACCKFGIRPSSPHLEKDFVMEIMVRRQEIAPQTSINPFGPLNTEWCVISKEWWDKWRHFVGKMRQRSQEQETDPGRINNFDIIKRTGAHQLMPHMRTGVDLEVIPPAVFAAVTSWYGGGPKIMRKVVPAKNGSTELELFPIVLNVCTCDALGKMRTDEKEFLFSKSATISEMTQELCNTNDLDPEKVRLWNYAQSTWRDQYILSPEITLESAVLKDGQLILMEISTHNGSWPRSQLHTFMQEEADAGESDESMTSLSGKNVVRINSGRVGLDNLGNTCYMNSSLQALLHTEHLMDFFLSQTHMQHINVSNKHGHGGRLAYFFGRLANEAWASPQRSISPRAFCGEVGSLNEQFAGHQQQDAQELLDFLLVGLSEDLNLVEDKPYVEMPDSDGRPESELADIWWESNQKRDLSIITSLFSGQFKSSTVCSCGHNSARYEPFTLLSVAIPEETYRYMTMHVFTRGVSYGVQCRVGVPRTGTFQTLVDAIFHIDYKPPIAGSSKSPLFVAAEVISSRIKKLYTMDYKIALITDTENIFLFEVTHNPEDVIENKHVILDEKEKVVVQPDEINEKAKYDESAVALAFSEPEFGQAKEETGMDTHELNAKSLGAPEPRMHASSMVGKDVRVAFAHRKMRPCDSGGLEYFQLAVFGLPLFEVLPTQFTGAALYSIIEKRVAPYLKGRVEQLQGLSSIGLESLDHGSQDGSSFVSGQVRPMQDEEAVSGQIPNMGFVLRYVSGSWESTCSCSRCPWLSQCRGCFIPQNDEQIDLLDGQTIAIDWHMIVFEEMIDNVEIMKIQVHPSAGFGKSAYERRIPLSRCLEKFTENEPLENFVCAKCKTDESMKRSFKLWRLPPVLVIQVKRFQFDHTSRRKLNNHIDFPLDGLDMESYLAEAQKVVVSQEDESTSLDKDEVITSVFKAEINSAVQKAVSDGHSTGTLDGLPLTKQSGVGCTVYDLYAVVHHIGLLGGGHYVTTVRESRKPRVDSNLTKSSSKTEIQSLDTSDTASTQDSECHAWSDRWWLFNDGQVTPLNDNNEVSAASAYVLFYMRRDAREKSASDLFPQGKAFNKDRTKDFMPTFRKNRSRGFNERLQDVGRSGANAIRRLTGARVNDEIDSQNAQKESKDCILS